MLNVMIIGGGKVGYYLLKSIQKQHDATLVEKNRRICEKIAEEFGNTILCGDGTSLEVLKDAGIEYCDLLAAVTGKDEENLIICQMAKLNFGIKKTIARVNNPKNIEVFKKLGVDQIVCSTEVISNFIEMSFEEGAL